jgi:hypothetical protein
LGLNAPRTGTDRGRPGTARESDAVAFAAHRFQERGEATQARAQVLDLIANDRSRRRMGRPEDALLQFHRRDWAPRMDNEVREDLELKR